MTLTVEDNTALIRRAEAAVARARELAEQTRIAIGIAATRVRDAALASPESLASDRSLTSVLQAFSELERAGHATGRLIEDAASTRHELARARGRPDRAWDEVAVRDHSTTSELPRLEDGMRGALRAAARTIAFAEAAWQLTHQGAELVEEASRAGTGTTRLVQRTSAGSALWAVRGALRSADAAVAGTAAAARHLADAAGPNIDLSVLLGQERAALADIA